MRGVGLGLIAPALAAALAGATPVLAGDVRMLSIRPSMADPGVKNFDDPSLVFIPHDAPLSGPLVVFLTGTGGRPRGVASFASLLAQSGLRVLALEYDDSPAVAERCPTDPNPACAGAFRQMRVNGDAQGAPVENTSAEAVIPRLRAALLALDHADPAGNWSAYLVGDAPAWPRIIVSGLSQGAGMAAFIAKEHSVARVVLFSSPWDVTGPDHHPAPWLSLPSRTPPERWFAEYHAKEKTAAQIQRAYAALGIPAANLRVFDRDLPSNSPPSPNPYHVNTIRDPRYAPDWLFLYGVGR